MIFVTVGTQLPFDRLLRTIDEWIETRGYEGRVFAQTSGTTYVPRRFEHKAFVEPTEFQTLGEQADFIVAHAGMGTILTALELGKPIIVMPRKAALGEHRNDHQLATARYLRQNGVVTVADDEAQLLAALDGIGSAGVRTISPHASPALLGRLTAFLDDVARKRAK